MGLLVLAAFLSQTLVLSSAASAFRLSKWLVAGSLAFAATVILSVQAVQRGKLILPRSRLMTVVTSLPLLMAVSAIYSTAAGTSLHTAGWAGAVSLVIVGVSCLGGAHRRRVAWAAFWGAELSAGVGLLQAAGVDVLGISQAAKGARYRITGLAGNPADLAMASLLAVALLAWLLSGGRRRGGWWWLLAAPLVAVTVATRTLTALPALAALMLVLGYRLLPARRRLLTIGVAAIIIGLAGVAALPRVETALQRVRKGDWYHLLSARGDGWSAAAEMIRERPLTGIGAGSYSCRFAPARLAWLERHGGTGARGELATHFQWAHCDPLQLVAELGVLGCLWLGSLAWVLACSRVRRHPAWLPALVVVVPFTVMHYPFHLAVMVFPLVILVGDLVVTEAGEEEKHRIVFRAVSWAVVAPALAVLVWAAGAGVVRLDLDLWLGKVEGLMAVAKTKAPKTQAPMLLSVEREALTRLHSGSWEPGLLWRIVGRCRLGRSAAPEAETAFRSSMASCQHEEAWLGLGMSLAAENRREEGIVWLVRACRINPALVQVIPAGSLREAVEQALGRTKQSARAQRSNELCRDRLAQRASS